MSDLAFSRTEMKEIVIAHAAVNSGMMANFGRQFAERLVAEGAELHFFASELPVFGWPPCVRELEAIGGQFHGLCLPAGFAPLAELMTVIRMARELRRLRPQFLHTRGSVMGLVGRVAGRLARVPCLIHHQDDLYCRDSSFRPAFRTTFAAIERGLAKLSHKSLFVSRAVLEDALKIGFVEKHCVFVGHDLNPIFQRAMANPPSPRPRHRLLQNAGISEQAKVIGCIGRLAPLKGMDTLIAAAAIVRQQHPDCVFFVKGDGPLRDTLHGLIAQKGLGGQIVLCHDEIPPQELPHLYRSFDMFMLPTRREGFGMVFAEAMSLGVPVIGPKIAPITEVVPEDCGLLVQAENPQAYADAIGALMMDDGLREGFIERGVAWARQTWGGESAAERVVEVYRQLLHDRKAMWGLAR